MADNIRGMKYDSDAILFITEVASLYENMPPAPQEKDLVVAVLPDQVDIFRTSPEVAEDTWRRFNRLGAQ